LLLHPRVAELFIHVPAHLKDHDENTAADLEVDEARVPETRSQRTDVKEKGKQGWSSCGRPMNKNETQRIRMSV
jgi:hypothetical protein